MKKTKVFSLILALTLVLSIMIPGTFAVAEGTDTTTTNSGLTLNKTATYNEATDDYTIALEAFATGVISSGSKPADIVLVLDQSGSMGYCMNCGAEYKYDNRSQTEKWDNDSDYCSGSTIEYVPVGKASEVAYSATETYYYLSYNFEYTEAVYCSGGGLLSGHFGHNGWYQSPSRSDDKHGYSPLYDTMLYKQNSGGNVKHKHRLDALKEAVEAFCKSIADASTTEMNHKVAVVGYSSSDYNNTELLTGVSITKGTRKSETTYRYYPTGWGNGKNYYNNYNGITVDDYKNALQDMSTTAGKTSVTNAKNALSAAGGTKTDDGLTMAENIFKYNTVSTDTNGDPTRNRIVILFTDGDTDSSRKDTINTAYNLKNTYNATVYTVGIFDGANGTPVTSWDGVSDANRFMHLLSSNFKNAQVTGSWTGIAASTNTYPAGNSSYYLSAKDSNALNSIFEQIAANIEKTSSSTELTSEAVIKDVVSDQFEIPAGAEVTLETYACTGKDTNGNWVWTKNVNADGTNNTMGATVTKNGDTVSVTGFDFKDNYVSEVKTGTQVTGYRGNKLVIKFNVKAKDGFLGGNDVYTNESAKVYENAVKANADVSVAEFNKPTVNVPIGEITITAEDKNVYLKDVPTASELGYTVKCGNVDITDLSKLEDWQTAYATPTVSLTKSTGFDATADGNYTVRATVAPNKVVPNDSSSGPVATTQTGTVTKNINVFKPELTYQDGSAYYGDTAPAASDYQSCLVSTEWKHGNTKDSAVTMIGTAPVLSMTYTPDASAIANGKVNTKADFAVDVTVKIGGADVTQYVTFKHNNCANKTCNLPDEKEFLIHVKTCSLTLKKTDGKAGESYVFDVYKDGTKYTEVTIVGNNSVTIYELPVGTYRVEEKTDWSWRYTATYTGNNAALNKTTPTGTIVCTNTLKTNEWLNGFSDVVANVFGITHN